MSLVPPEIVDEPLRPMSRAEYNRLTALGFYDDENVELLYGRVVQTTPQQDPHAYAVERLSQAMYRVLLDLVRIRVQLPMVAAGESEPEPDLLVAALEHRPGHHPTEAFWIVEVADSTLRKDLGVKAVLYAQSGVPEYWVVDIPNRRIHVFSEPQEGRYRSRRRVEGGEAASPAAFPQLVVAVDSLFIS